MEKKIINVDKANSIFLKLKCGQNIVITAIDKYAGMGNYIVSQEALDLCCKFLQERDNELISFNAFNGKIEKENKRIVVLYKDSISYAELGRWCILIN